MDITIKKIQLGFNDNANGGFVTGLLFIPATFSIKTMAIFTHGYTSHKASILNWCVRLCESGVSCLLFDLPGHYLANSSDISDFESFKKVSPLLFEQAHRTICEEIIQRDELQDLSSWKLALGGHSLGALIALQASELSALNRQEKLQIVCVGFGLPPAGITHVFDTPFYKSTLNIRGQLVSPCLQPSVIFPWIKEEKERLQLKNKHIYLLTGLDDIVVGKNGTELLAEQLKKLGNQVIFERPSKLAHHLPENAAAHIKKFFKNQNLL